MASFSCVVFVQEDDNTEADGTEMGILFVVLHSPLYVFKSKIDWSQTRRISIVVVEVGKEYHAASKQSIRI